MPSRVPMRYAAPVWCGAMPRRGSGQNAGWHMLICRDCQAKKDLLDEVTREQSGC